MPIMSDRVRADLRRRLQRLGGRKRVRPVSPAASSSRPMTALTHVIGGEEVRTPRGAFHLREVTYALHHVHGRYPLGRILDAPTRALSTLKVVSGAAPPSVTHMAFLDTETLGLSRGTGTVVFMVGLGLVSEHHIQVYQYFIRDLDEEAAMLEHLAHTLAGVSVLVTYNGNTFDVPLLRTRYILNAIPSPLGEMGHLDLLVHARRLWAHRLPRCTLGEVEQGILNHRRDELDIPGWLVPVLYRDYLRTGDPTPLRQVFYHNLHDILSLIALADVVLRGWDDPWSEPLLLPEDLIGQALYFIAQGEEERAETTLRHALRHATRPDRRRDAYRALGRLFKRRERWADALATWEAWAQELPLPDLTPFEELAKYYEWRAHDLHQALRWTLAALDALNQAPPDVIHRWRPALEHRRDRLLRRLQKHE